MAEDKETPDAPEEEEEEPAEAKRAAELIPATEREQLLKELGLAVLEEFGERAILRDVRRVLRIHDDEYQKAWRERPTAHNFDFIDSPESAAARSQLEKSKESVQYYTRSSIAASEKVKEARLRLREYDAKQFPANLAKANKAVGAAAFVVASLIVQLANGTYQQPWFVWGMRWSLCGVASIIAFYMVRGGVSYFDWRRRKWSADELESFGIRDWIIRVELVVFLLQLAFLFLAAWQVVVGLNLLPGGLTT